MGIGNSFKGFETVFAAIRMFWQMTIRLIAVALVLQVIFLSAIIYFQHEKIYGKLEASDLCLIRTYASARIAYKISPVKQKVSVEYSCERKPMCLNYVYFINKFEPYVLMRLKIIKDKTIGLILWTSSIYLFVPLLMVYFSRRHKRDIQDKFIRGAKIVSPDKLRELIEQKSPSEYRFKITENIQIPIGIITRHCICLGKPGSGKTQLISRIVEQIIKSGFRAIIHDFKGDFITTFYDHRKHLIFNPLDKRHMGLKDAEMDLIDQCEELTLLDLDDKIKEKFTFLSESRSEKILPQFEYATLLDSINHIVDCIKPDSRFRHVKEQKKKVQKGIKGWSVFNELKSSIDIDAFCASLIPESASQDNFWPISSRQLLGSIITYCIHNKITSYAELWKIVNLGNEQLLEMFKGTPGCEEGAKLLTEAKTANNILAVMSNYTKPIKYLIGTEGEFSIKEWVKDSKNEKKTIFLSNYAMIQETIRPFLTMFADFSIKTLLSLDDDLNRRLFFILDEFGELGKIGTIVPLLTGSRSKGGAGFLLIQDTARINTIYGQDGCSTIVNACGNLISFAVKKEEAEFTSECFGSMEIKRTEQSKSMGVDNISDSISISEQTVEKRLVMPSEVTNVPTLNFYIQLTDYPVSRDKLDIISYDKKAQSYVGREDLLFRSRGSETGIQNGVGDELFSEVGSGRMDQELERDKEYYGELEPGTTKPESIGERIPPALLSKGGAEDYAHAKAECVIMPNSTMQEQNISIKNELSTKAQSVSDNESDSDGMLF